jgi:hypothetical protein
MGDSRIEPPFSGPSGSMLSTAWVGVPSGRHRRPTKGRDACGSPSPRPFLRLLLTAQLSLLLDVPLYAATSVHACSLSGGSPFVSVLQ